MRNLVKIFKALSDPQRIRILKMLEIKALCVCEIADVLQLANSTVSKHLSILRDIDLILDKKEGKWVNYSLNLNNAEYKKRLRPLINAFLHDNPIIQDDSLKLKSIDRHEICKII